MTVGESWTNSFGETVTVTATGLRVGNASARNTHSPRAPQVEESPFLAPVPYYATPKPDPAVRAQHAQPTGEQEPLFLEPVPYAMKRR